MRGRAGSTLVELVTALALLAILGTACVALLRSQAGLLRSTSGRAASSEAMRTARGVLHAELRDLATADLRAASRDSLALRVFRGYGIACARDEENVVIRYRGLREPDPGKDSLLLVRAEQAIAFRLAADRVSCGLQPGERRFTIQTPDSLPPGTVFLVFESGAYHFAADALRYRRGPEGRQPLTDELIDDRRSAFLAEAQGIRIVLRGDANDAADSYVRFTNAR